MGDDDDPLIAKKVKASITKESKIMVEMVVMMRMMFFFDDGFRRDREIPMGDDNLSFFFPTYFLNLPHMAARLPRSIATLLP